MSLNLLEKTNVFFRVDGGVKSGLGHLVRCLALAQIIEESFSIVFLCKEIPQNVKEEIAAKGYSLILLENDEQLCDLLDPKSLIVLDGYHFDSAYQKSIKNHGHKLICIDDLYNQKFYADLIINHVPGVKKEDYDSEPYTKFALGLPYALLRKPFFQYTKDVAVATPIKSVFICFGGSDEHNLTLQILKDTLDYADFEKINIVTGGAYLNKIALEAYCQNFANVSYHHAIDENQMAKLMYQSDLIIVPASGLLYEAVAIGCKIISGIIVENQKIFYERFLKLGSFVTAEDFNSNSFKAALATVSETDFIPAKLVDSLSPQRYLTMIKAL